jgi:hypothetical protein
VRRQIRSLKASKHIENKKKPTTADLHLTTAQQQRREYLHERYRSVRSLYVLGCSLRKIARIVQIDTNTLRYGCRKASRGPRFDPIEDEKPEKPAWMLTSRTFINDGKPDAKT